MASCEEFVSLKFETNDFDELCEAALGWDQDYNQMSGGQFEGGLHLTQIGSRQVMREYFGKKIWYRGTAPANSFGFGLPIKQSGQANCVGYTVDNNTVVLQTPGQEADLITGDFWDSIVLSYTEEDIRTITSALSNKKHRIWHRTGTIQLSPDAAMSIRRLALNLLDQEVSESNKSKTRMAFLHDQLMKFFLWNLLQVQESEAMDVKPHRPANIVKRATDYVLADATGKAGLTEICKEVGVSLRSLHYAFQDVTGLPAATWLRQVRLNRVHRLLACADPGTSSVQSIAETNGFFHKGHFSAQYRKFYGRLPSETLKSA